MEYRMLPHGGEKIGVIGMGSSVVGAQKESDIAKTVRAAFDLGVNYFDMAGGHATIFPAYGKALHDIRSQVYLQVHFGVDYTTGEYGWTTELDEIKKSVDWQLKNLQTDYIDFGFIHCLDEEADLAAYEKNGVLKYLTDLQTQGVVHHLGLSSHTPLLANRVLDMKLIDMLMFSINPGYDYQHGDYANGSAAERMELYRRCETEGVGISVMKAFAGGQLLNAKTSPFGRALTEYQCIQYVLDKPGVLTVLPGVRNREDLKRVLGFLNASDEEKDYSVISVLTPKDAEGACVYCNHCQPCPAGLDVGLINKYYDLALAGDALAADHYRNLSVRADACAGCGHCNRRCPFHVDQVSRMRKISAHFD